LVAKRKVIGVFCVGSSTVNQYDAATAEVVGQIGGLVATAANNMLLFEQLQAQLARLHRTQSQLIRSARLAAVGELADGVAHEINNPLSVILGVTQLLLRQHNMPQGALEDLEKIGVSANRVATIIRTFIEFAKPTTAGKQFPVQIDDLLEAAFLLVKSQTEFSDKPVKLDRCFSPDLPLIMGNEGQLRRAFVDIIRNAFEAMAKVPPPPAGHMLRLQAYPRRDNGQAFVDVSIEDTGCGIPARNLSRIFEPGFTTKIDRGTVRGLGMGLFSAYGIIDTHGGNINIESEEGSGTRVLVSLPALQ
jgi:two-component system NtrC family sensor kinase